MDRVVIGTISVGRRVLLLADVIVRDSPPLVGGVVDDVDTPGEVRVIAVTPQGEPRPLWNPANGRRLDGRDKLTVVCSRAGLSDLIQRANPGRRA